MQYCANPGRKDAPVENVGVLVVESRFDGKSIWLYAVCPDGMYADEEGAFHVAARAAQAYCDRWQIETSFPDRARSRQKAFPRGKTPGGAYPQPAGMAKIGPKTGPDRRFFA